jgi:hypothetical protein
VGGDLDDSGWSLTGKYTIGTAIGVDADHRGEGENSCLLDPLWSGSPFLLFFLLSRSFVSEKLSQSQQSHQLHLHLQSQSQSSMTRSLSVSRSVESMGEW